MTPIEQHIVEINKLCQRHNVKELYMFGSITDSKRFTAQSDIDLIVRFKDEVIVEDYADLYFSLADSLEALLKRKIDLMTFKPIRNRILRENIELSKQIVYAA